MKMSSTCWKVLQRACLSWSITVNKCILCVWDITITNVWRNSRELQFNVFAFPVQVRNVIFLSWHRNRRNGHRDPGNAVQCTVHPDWALETAEGAVSFRPGFQVSTLAAAKTEQENSSQERGRSGCLSKAGSPTNASLNTFYFQPCPNPFPEEHIGVFSPGTKFSGGICLLSWHWSTSCCQEGRLWNNKMFGKNNPAGHERNKHKHTQRKGCAQVTGDVNSVYSCITWGAYCLNRVGGSFFHNDDTNMTPFDRSTRAAWKLTKYSTK